MKDRYTSVRLDVDPRNAEATVATEASNRPFDILVFGDFSGRASRGDPAPPPRPLRIDRDDFDTVLEQLAPRIRLVLDEDSPPLEITIRDLDDFHPDGLYDRAPLLGQLRELRRRALDPRAIADVAVEIGHDPSRFDDGGAAAAGKPAHGGSGGVLDLILEETPAPPEDLSPETVLRSGGDLAPLVRRLVRPHLVPAPDPRQADVIAAIDAALAAGMRRILHHPDFQRMEAMWRGLFLLVREVETSAQLRIHIVDLADEEMDAALLQARPMGAGSAHGAGFWGEGTDPALLVVLRSFSGSTADLAVLRQLAETAREAGAPCLAGAAPEFLAGGSAALDTSSRGTPGDPAGWRELRHHPAAPFLGLARPRFLLRLPYGEDTDECERFPFEEFAGEPAESDYLWGEPALACALLLGRAFAREGWEMRPGRYRELHGLPIPLERLDGDVVARQATESSISEAEADALLESGVIPLAPIRDRGALRVVRFQSIADPPAPLAGRWSVL